MQVNRIQQNNYSTQPNFGMAVTSCTKGKKMLEKYLTPKGAKELERIIESEKSCPVNVHITTLPISLITLPIAPPTLCDAFAVVVEDKTFKMGMMEVFSTSRAMISAIKKGVKYAHSLTDKRNVLKNIPEK